ncbi:MAG: LVIVD repeat-containing protein [Candidatus Dormibacteraceae bacterium]
MKGQTLDGAISNNVRFVSNSSMGGKADGAQVMVDRGFAYIGHLFSHGFSVIDVADPRDPKPVLFVPSMENCWSPHLQTFGDLLLVANSYDFFANPKFADEKNYYTQSVGQTMEQAGAAVTGGGMRIYDISSPGHPRQIGELSVDGLGVHRIWYVGGKYAYLSALLNGYADCVFMVVDVGDPAHPHEVGRWWLPGMWTAGGEKPSWPAGDRVALHHAIIAKDVAYGSWRDGGLTLLDVSEPSKPALIAHRNWHPPFGGGTHTSLPLTDRVPVAKPYVVVADEAVADECADQVKYTWMVDVREKSNPINVSTLPTPSERDYCKEGGHFGPHNLHENRPGAFQSSNLIFATYQNAGVRVFDISNPHQPYEAGHFVPPAKFEFWMDNRPNRPRVIHSVDVYVDKEGLMYMTDFNAGVFILEWQGT